MIPGRESRESFATRVGAVATMVGVAAGLGNVWRFPYMTGRYGGAAFVVLYVAFVVAIGIPALRAEWSLGRRTGRGPVGAYDRAGLPGGRVAGWILFGVVAAATAYYTNVLGWVAWHAVGEAARGLGRPIDAAAILPPEAGASPRSLGLQLACTGAVVGACAIVLLRGLRAGIEPVSRWIVPGLLVALVVVTVRSLTLPGAGEGVRWYLGKFELASLTPGVALAALGQAVFSLSLGGTFMVVYGSYLDRGDLRREAGWTAAGDTAVGLLAGLAIVPAVFALGLEPTAGPAVLFESLPAVFERIPAGWVFGLVFFAGLFGAAWLSDVAAFEVLVAGLTDATSLSRRAATGIAAAAVLVLAVPSMVNLRVFVGWDLVFGSGMQTVGALLAVVTVGWAMDRAAALEELGAAGRPPPRRLLAWLRFGIPLAMVAVGAWWLAGALGVAGV